jgi:alanyl-tRNA synthetase
MGDVTGAFGILWEAITDIVYNPITMFKAGLYGLQAALGQMVSWIGDWLDDDLKRWGDELRGSAEQKLETLREEFKEDKAKRTRIDNMTSEEIAKAADELRKKDMEYANNLTAKTEEVREGIEQVARNTATEDTKSRFQAESFTLLSESLDAIMGVSSSRTAELSDVVDALDIANAQRQEQIDKSGGATVEPM